MLGGTVEDQSEERDRIVLALNGAILVQVRPCTAQALLRVNFTVKVERGNRRRNLENRALVTLSDARALPGTGKELIARQAPRKGEGRKTVGIGLGVLAAQKNLGAGNRLARMRLHDPEKRLVLIGHTWTARSETWTRV